MKKIIVLIYLISYSSFTQTQVGNDIYGILSGDRFGTDVAMSGNGNIIAISAPGFDNVYESTGQVKVFEKVNDDWVQIGQDINGIEIVGLFGSSIAISSNGHIIAIGSPFSDVSGNRSGKVEIYEYNGIDNWIHKGQVINGISEYGEFGTSISISSNGQIIAIGAPSNNANGEESGQVKIYEYNGIDLWVQKGQDINGSDAFDEFGEGISISSNGDIIAVIAPRNDDNGLNTGQVKIYEYNGISQWIQKGQSINGSLENDLGSSVELSANGNIVAVGTARYTLAEDLTGSVRVFEFIIDSWVQLGDEIFGDNIGDSFGKSICLSVDGTILGVAAPTSYINNNYYDGGKIKIFKNISGLWTQIGTNINGYYHQGYFGSSCAISLNGDYIIGGGVGTWTGTNPTGYAAVFDLSGVLNVKEHNISNFNLYPNPTKTQLTIQLNTATELENVIIYNHLGQNILTSKKSIIDTSKLASGLYVVEIQTNKGKGAKKLIIE